MFLRLDDNQTSLSRLIEQLHEHFPRTYADSANWNFRDVHLHMPKAHDDTFYLESRTPAGELWLSLNMPEHAVILKR